jgi:signal transduction histidine kinase
MWKRLSLRARIFLILAALMVTTLTGGVVTMWYSRASDALFTSLIDQNVASFQTADDLENNLIMQKGFLTYYFLDGNPDWLKELARYHRAFQASLLKARKLAYTVAMGEILDEIDTHYHNLLEVRDQVIALYKDGEREAGARLHQEVRKQFYDIYNLCERAKLIQEYAIARARTESQARARFINTLALVVMPSVAVLGLALAYILIKQILQPIRSLALKTGPANGDAPLPDEVKALSRGVQSLIADMGQAQSQLERSQEHLLQAEKLAMAGKLAAGVAHSIRNPLASVNMRLFVLRRSLNMTANQQEDFEVISEEIKHIDRIVEDFLGFSRPPKLKMQRISPSDVVDSALQLLRHRLESYDVKVELSRDGRLPEVPADPEQLKEVLVNLLINACEAMGSGGLIKVRESLGTPDQPGRTAIIEVADNGPGMPQSIREKVFQPFFSTKEEGTGLGLSIASRIVEDHGGSIRLQSREGQGTIFTITLPYKEEEVWAPSS